MRSTQPDHSSKAGPGISDELIFKVAKEVVVKFIEVGRLTPSEFDETFATVYQSIRKTVQET